MLQSRPMTAPDNTWANAQTLVPRPDGVALAATVRMDEDVSDRLVDDRREMVRRRGHAVASTSRSTTRAWSSAVR